MNKASIRRGFNHVNEFPRPSWPQVPENASRTWLHLHYSTPEVFVQILFRILRVCVEQAADVEKDMMWLVTSLTLSFD